MALSMEEQRMLDEMERQLAIDDPKLAARLNTFGRQRMPGSVTSHRAKTISGLLALALIAAITIMMFVLSPYGASRRPHRTAHRRPLPNGGGIKHGGRRLALTARSGQDSRQSWSRYCSMPFQLLARLLKVVAERVGELLEELAIALHCRGPVPGVDPDAVVTDSAGEPQRVHAGGVPVSTLSWPRK